MNIESFKNNLKPSEIAKKLDVSIFTVIYWIKIKKLPAFKENGRWYVKLDVFEDFLKEFQYD